MVYFYNDQTWTEIPIFIYTDFRYDPIVQLYHIEISWLTTDFVDDLSEL